MSKSLPKTTRGRGWGELNRVQLSLKTPLPSRNKVMKDKTIEWRVGELLCTQHRRSHQDGQTVLSLMTKQPGVVLKLSTFSATTLMCLCSWSVGAGGWVSHVTCRWRGGYACSLGCDTTSYPVGKGQVSALKAMRVVPGDLRHFIGQEGATDLQITETVRFFFSWLCTAAGSLHL